MIKNILWDVDGTLFDTYPAITFAFSKSLNELGQAIALNVIDGLVHQSLDHCVETLAQRFKLDPNLLRHLAHDHYLTVPPENQPPFVGVKDVCAYIHENGGSNIALTHRATASAQQFLNVHHLAPFFAGTISIEQGYTRKPAPAMFDAAILKFKLDRAFTLVVGDRELDVLAGQAAGIRTCLFGESTLSIPVDYRIDDYKQLLALLKKR